jgi:hypothetical protein
MGHRITRSEVEAAAALLPGYGAIRLNPPRPRRLRLRHFAVLLVGLAAGLVAAGTYGLLP